jgi:hypothetical protein
VFGAIVGAGFRLATGWAIRMIWSGSTKALVFGLAGSKDGTHTEFDPGERRALKPLMGARSPADVMSPILIRSRRLRPAAISSRRFLAALSISLYRPLETFSPNTLKYTVSSPLGVRI